MCSVDTRLGCLLALAAAGLLACSALRPGCPACVDSDPVLTGCPFSTSILAAQATPIVNPTLLLLSGGASYGAWGAGVLAGWGPSRPAFTVVTGISTGALQATHAFVGNRDAELKPLFADKTNADIFSWKWYAFWSNSLQSREPLWNLIEDALTVDAIRDVKQESDSGRELWVGTVNLDTSQFCPWNLSDVARRMVAAETLGDLAKAKRYLELYRKIVFAASGSPVIAPPVLIDAGYYATGVHGKGAMHVDGGARLRVFMEGVLAEVLQTGTTPCPPTGPPGTTNPTVYAVVNGKLRQHPQCVEDWIGTIALRSLEISNSEAMYGSLYYLRDMLPNVCWRLSRIPDDYCLDFPSSKFDPAKLQPLFDKGVWWGSQPDPWERTIPPREPAPWPANCDVPFQGCKETCF